LPSDDAVRQSPAQSGASSHHAAKWTALGVAAEIPRRMIAIERPEHRAVASHLEGAGCHAGDGGGDGGGRMRDPRACADCRSNGWQQEGAAGHDGGLRIAGRWDGHPPCRVGAFPSAHDTLWPGAANESGNRRGIATRMVKCMAPSIGSHPAGSRGCRNTLLSYGNAFHVDSARSNCVPPTALLPYCPTAHSPPRPFGVPTARPVMRTPRKWSVMWIMGRMVGGSEPGTGHDSCRMRPSTGSSSGRAL
jgi:hypothetical protein